jgi:hypothetical protein
MKKTIFTATTALLMLAILIMPSFASAAGQPNYVKLSIEKLAYSDLDSAPEEWKSAILTARESIIYSKSWTIEGQVSYELPDGTIKQLPEFSDLFPGWDVPKLNKAVSDKSSTALNDPIFTIMTANYAGYVYLKAPPTNQESPVFYVFTTNVNRVTTIADSLAGTSFNAGYTDLTDGYDVGWAVNLPVGSKMWLLDPYSSHTYGARASTNSTEGYALMGVYDDPK